MNNNKVHVVFKTDEYSAYASGRIVQWNDGGVLQIDGLDTNKDIEVHFYLTEHCGTALRMPVEIVNNSILVDVPAFIVENEAASECHYNAFAFVYVSEGEKSSTERKVKFKVETRPKPDDYVHGKDEVLTWKKLENRIEELEQKGISEERIAEAVNAYLAGGGEVTITTDPELNESSTNPVQNQAVAKAVRKLSDEKLDATKLSEAIDEALARAKESGEFKGEQGEQGIQGPKGDAGADGKDGYTPIKDKDYFTETDKDEIVSSVIALLPVYGGEVANA